MPSTWIFPPPNLSTKCCFIIENSEWVEQFQGVSGHIETSFGKPFFDLKHFVIAGADDVVEVLSFEPKIEKIDVGRTIRQFAV